MAEGSRREPSPHFFHREPDGSVRFRLRLNRQLASLIEEAAGETPLMSYIYQVLEEHARYHAELARQAKAEQIGRPDPNDPT